MVLLVAGAPRDFRSVLTSLQREVAEIIAGLDAAEVVQEGGDRLDSEVLMPAGY